MKFIVAILTITILFITNKITAQNNTITAKVINAT